MPTVNYPVHPMANLVGDIQPARTTSRFRQIAACLCLSSRIMQLPTVPSKEISPVPNFKFWGLAMYQQCDL